MACVSVHAGKLLARLATCRVRACRLVAVLEKKAFVYVLESLEKLCTLDTPPNPKVQLLLQLRLVNTLTVLCITNLACGR